MYKQYVLKNGLTVILAPRKETQTVTALLLVKAGSRYEDKDVRGISHFVEHMMFKGTKKRPSTFIISQELDSVGADYNAFTSKDHTGYYVKVNAGKKRLALELLSDMMFSSVFSAEELKREKGVIMEEMNMYQDNPIMYVEDLVEELTFSGNKLGELIIGTKKTVGSINREKILKYWQYFYQPSNMVLGLAGNFQKTDINLVKKYFEKADNRRNKISFTPFLSSQRSAQNKILYKKTDQVQLAMSWSAYGYRDVDIYPAYLLATILGGTMSSRLFIEIREKRGLAYYIKATNNVYEDTGCFVVQAGLDKKRWREAVGLVWQEMEKIKKYGVTDEELERAKEFLRGKLAIDLEDSAHLADWYAKQKLLSGKIMEPKEKLQKILKVKASDVKRIAQNIFVKNQLNLAVIGEVKKVEKNII
ncbi:MAG: pitrilysin family protein [Patescibacteria group bacterium]|jgi:predicted Zn-dependent peptidase